MNADFMKPLPLMGLSLGLGAILATLYQPFVRHPFEIGGCILLGILLAHRWAGSVNRSAS